MRHPSTLTLHRLRYGELDEPESAALRAHLKDCEACAARLRAQENHRAAFELAPVPPAIRAATAAAPRRSWRWLAWLAPWRMEGDPVWIVLVTHFIGQRNQLRETLFGSIFDPDIDEGRNYLIQNMWYTQSLERLGWIATGDIISIDEAREDFNGDRYFTDGHLAVIWLSGEPVSMLETQRAKWSDPPPIMR